MVTRADSRSRCPLRPQLRPEPKRGGPARSGQTRGSAIALRGAAVGLRWRARLAQTFCWIALAVSPAAQAQEVQWDVLWQKGLELLDREMDARGYEWDRERLASLPRVDELTRFLSRIQTLLEQGSIEEIAWWRPEVEASVNWLEQFPAAGPYANWLRQQLDYFVVAEEAVAPIPEAPHRPTPSPREPPKPLSIPQRPPSAPLPARQQAERKAASVEVWKKRIAARPPPARAAELAPRLKSIFRENGIPEELVWLAEVESSFDPNARNPVGAVGLFQFMPPTARRFGLNVERPDERIDPEKSARAAAAYLRILHRQFGSWPLALAGYNAGEGRVARTLKKHSARTFDEIAEALPLETRLYVPKVAAVIERREGAIMAQLPAPR